MTQVVSCFLVYECFFEYTRHNSKIITERLGAYMGTVKRTRRYIDVERLPVSMYSDVVRVREIISYKILDDVEQRAFKDKPNYQNNMDIAIYENGRIKNIITREQLVKQYKRLNGTRIRMIGLHYHKMYNAVCSVNKEYKLLKIPKKSRYSVTIAGNKVPAGCLVLFSVNENGINYNDKTIIQTIEDVHNFRAQFKVVQQPDLYSARNHVNDLAEVQTVQKEIESADARQVWSPKDRDNVKDELSGAQLIATHRIMRLADTSGKRVPAGYVLKDIKTGESKACTFMQVKQECMKKNIKNLTIVAREDTKKVYFRGVGIKIENLPQIPLERCR